jgi:hypothetical protein
LEAQIAGREQTVGADLLLEPEHLLPLAKGRNRRNRGERADRAILKVNFDGPLILASFDSPV